MKFDLEPIDIADLGPWVPKPYGDDRVRVNADGHEQIGPVAFNHETLEIVIHYRAHPTSSHIAKYYWDAEHLTDGKALLDMLFQVHKKGWCTPEIVEGLIAVVRRHCPGGAPQSAYAFSDGPVHLCRWWETDR